MNVRSPAAALTFDDGPDPVTTPRLLDMLGENGIRATFFCVGKYAEENPGVIRRIHEEGHTIGNHTWDHPSMPHVGRAERRRQVERCSRALGPHEAPFFRPPYGSQSVASHLDVVWSGYDVVTWDVDSHDWLTQDPEGIARRIQMRIRPGSIVLLHDRITSAPDPGRMTRHAMLRAVELVIARLGSEIDFVTIPELIRRGEPHRAHWYRRADVEWLNTLNAEVGGAWRYPTASRRGA